MDYKSIITSNINVACQALGAVAGAVEVPPNPEMGDVAFPCFSLAKTLRKAPPLIAKDVKELICQNATADFTQVVDRVETVGGYVNFFVKKSSLISGVIDEINNAEEDYGRMNEVDGKTVLVEFSSPNIAKPFHVGHLVSTALGSSLERIYRFLGYKTVKINHIGDWGTQFGKLISAYKHWGDRGVIEKDPINELLKIYVRFHKEAEEKPELEDEARHYFKLLEDGDKEVTELWQFFVSASLTEFNRMYRLLGISFDSYAGESFYTDKMPEIVNILKEKNLLEESDGAMVVRFEDDNMPPCIILKSDGTTIYATRDIAAAVYRKRHYDFYKNIYVVGTPQTLHFKQVFSVIGKMGFDWADNCVHVDFGYVRFPDKSMSTRHGDVILLEDLLNMSISKTKEIIAASSTSKDIDNIDELAQKIGVGAVIFAFLKNSRERDIIFTWDDILDFEGESGPYVQYAYARGKSILRKASEMPAESGDSVYEPTNEEFELAKLLNDYSGVVQDAAAKNQPCIITRYTLAVAAAFNKFYNTCNIMKSTGITRTKRIELTNAMCCVIKSALHLIGVDVVEKM